MKLAAVIVAGLLSVLLGEVTMVTWLGISDRFMDVTGNFWLQGIVPAVFIVVLVQALILWPIYRSNPLRYGIAYAVTYTVFNAVELTLFFNPVADIATYVVTEIALVALVIGGFNQLFWKKSRAAPAASQ